MTAPTTGGPPECERPAPRQESRPSRNDTDTAESSRCVPEWKRRRAAAQRLAILDCGRADPWRYGEVGLTEHQRECWRRTVAHLRLAGFCAIVPAEVRAVLR